MDLGLASRPVKTTLSDVTISAGDKIVARLEGPLVPDRWTDLRLPKSAFALGPLQVSYSGEGGLVVADPCYVRPRSSSPKSAGRPNIIFVVLDSLLPSDIGLLNGKGSGSITPNIDRYFQSAFKFRQAYSQETWTLPALSTFLTGTFAIEHGVFNPYDHHRSLPDRLDTLPETLRDAGYRTLGVSTQLRFSPATGHHRGFERFIIHADHRESRSVICDALDFVDAHGDEPFFAMLHCFEPHQPFGELNYGGNLAAAPIRRASSHAVMHSDLREGSDEWWEEADDHRAGKVREMDFNLGLLFDYLERSGLLENTAIILTHDHGRTLKFRDIALTDGSTQAPLLIRKPRETGGFVDGLVENTVDLFATTLALADLPNPPESQGRDILAPDFGGHSIIRSERLFQDTFELSLRTPDWRYNLVAAFDRSCGKADVEQARAETLRAIRPDGGEEAENRLADFPEKAEEFRQHVAAHMKQAGAYFR
ncbi:MAG: sulfatase family protein [Magnetovibrionaceae bacterium]